MKTMHSCCIITLHTECLPVKEAGRDFTYLIVVLIGLGVTGEYSGIKKLQL